MEVKTTEKDVNDSEFKEGMSRRKFLKTTGAAMAMGMMSGMGAFNSPLFASGFDEYLKYDALGLAELVRRKQVKPEELLESAINRIEAINPKINAVVTKMYDEARKTISKGLPDGPFRGVPFLLKDIGAPYAGVRFTSGSKLFANNVPKNDCELVKRYKQAGLVTMGKTNTPEFGLVSTTESVFLGTARNPWNLKHSTGGSSGGSAAAVAARITPIAHGGDGGGSIRIPSSCCGVFGMKPTRGRIPMGPGVGEALEGFVLMHIISLSVRDNAAMLDATSAPDPGAPYGIPSPQRPFLKEVGSDPGSLKIALFSKAGSWKIHPDCIAAADDVAKLCESLGHKVEYASPEIDYEPLMKAFKLVFGGHLAATFDRVEHFTGKKVTADMVEPLSWEVAQIGWKASAADLAGSKAIINKTTREVAAFLNQFDVILSPTIPSPPAKLGEFDTVNTPAEELIQKVFRYCCFTFPFNITGNPAMSVPLFWNKAGLPIGTQFAASYANEAVLFRLAGQLENARPWFDKMPGI